MSRSAVLFTVLLVVGVGGGTSVRAQGGYMLRYEPGSRAAVVLDSLGFRQNAPLGQQDRRGAPPASGTRAADPAAAERPADRLTSDFVPFESVGAGEGLVAVRRGVPAAFWTDIEGVISVGEGSAVFPKGGLPDDPTFPEQWNLRRIEAAGAWNHSTGGFTPTGRQIVIGVIEANGFDLGHPELDEQYYKNPGEIPGNGIDDDRNGYVDDVTGVNFINGQTAFRPDFHGVQVCGVLAAESDNGQQATGLNWGAKLLPFHVDSVYKWALALDYLTTLRTRYNATDGAQGAYVVVVNCSLGNRANCGSPFNVELNAAIDRAGRAGILVVGAVGNDTGDADRQTDIPASCESEFLITVTASDQADLLLPGAGYSFRQVDLSAPGAPFGGLEFGSSRVNTFGQTSGATPQVAGVIALMYAAMCERLEAESLTRPGEVSAHMKTVLLSAVDLVDAQSRRVRSGGRLNARRAMESLLSHEECGGDDFLVKLAGAAPAPRTLTTAGGAALLTDTLSETWRIYRYAATRPRMITALELSELPSVAFASPDPRLVTTGREFDFGGGDAYLERIDQPAVASTVASQGALPEADRPVAAVFDLGFGESPDVLAGPRLNARAPSIGLHGTASAEVLARVADEDVGAGVVKYLGYRRGDWVAAADAAAVLRRAYGNNPGGAGRRIVTLATGLDQVLYSSGETGASTVTRFVLEELLGLGIVPVLPRGASGVATAGLPALPRGTLLAGGPGEDEFTREAPVVSAPDGGIGFGLSQSPTQFDGTLAAVAQVAGGVVLLSKLGCPGGGLDGPREEADQLVATLLGGSSAREATVPLDLVVAARLRAELCSGRLGGGAAILSVFPNPVGADKRARVIYAARSEGSLAIFDMAGRRVAERTFATPDGGFGQLTLGLDALPSGVYVVRLTSGDGVESAQVVVP